jgi:hypothetical protein
VVRYDAKAGERSLDVLRWGLVPFWAKDIKVGFSNINAKAEGIEGKPAFREAFQRRRCLVPVDNFYEWAKTATGKQPCAIALADRGLMALAGAAPRSNPRRGVMLYHEPVLAMLVQGSVGASASPACSSSMEMPSRVRIKAMRQSRGGRLIVTPRAIKALQVS